MKLLVAFALTSFYLLGVMLVFQRVTYPGFADVGGAQFPAAYAAFNARIGLPVVVPELLAVLLTIPLFFVRPAGVPAWSVGVAFALGLAYLAITFGWHLPVHRALAKGDQSPAVMAALLRTNAARTVVQAVKCGLAAWMLVVGAR